MRSEVLDERSWKYQQKTARFSCVNSFVSHILGSANAAELPQGSDRMLVDSCSPVLGMMKTVGSPALIQSRCKSLPLPPAGCSANLTSLSTLLQSVTGSLTGIPIL